MRHLPETGKRVDIYDQLLALHSDVDSLNKGVEEVEERVKKLSGEDKEGNVFGAVNSLSLIHI